MELYCTAALCGSQMITERQECEMMYLLLLVGFVLLIKGADWFVEGSSSIARYLRVPSVIIGLTIVAMGTSAPEAAVSITAGLQGNNDIALSNVIGSNIFNLMVVVGVCALMKHFDVDKTIVKRDYPISIAATVLLFIFMIDLKLTRIEGLILLVCMALYIALTIRDALRNRTEVSEDAKQESLLKSILFMSVGITAVVFGGDMVVDNACLIAEKLGLGQNLIGLTIVAIGTSLPELVTSIVAAKKGESGLALGNVIGSNIFNILFILGMSSGLHVITVSMQSIMDMIILFICTVSMFLWCKVKGGMGKGSGAVSVLVYVAYTVYIILR